MTRFVLTIFMLSVFVGCSKNPPSPIAQGIEVEYIDPTTEVKLTTHLESIQIGVADRVLFKVQAQWVSPATVILTEPEWEQYGWTKIDEIIKPVTVAGTQFNLESSYLLEPFLPGDYQTPPVELQVQPELNATIHTLTSMPMKIEVLSLLGDDDAGELDPVTGYFQIDSQQSPEYLNHPLLLSSIAIVIFFSLVTIWFLSRTPRLTLITSPYADFELIARNAELAQVDAFALLYNAFMRLDLRLQRTSEIKLMIEQCELARFSTSSSCVIDPVTMAQHTLELLGPAESGET